MLAITAEAKSVKINLVSFVPKMNISYRGWAPLFVDKINGRANGELTIKYRGGPEVIAPFDLAKAVASGVTDMAILSTGFYSSVVPGAGQMLYSTISTEGERKNGIYALQQEMHARAGLRFIGNLQPINGHFFYVCLRKPVKSKDDFKGLKFAGSPPFLPCFQALGGAAVKAALKEYYPMVERGVVDGNNVGLDVYLATGEYEVAPYVIDHPFYKSPNTVIMNLKKWNSLPKHLQELIEEVQLETENAWPAIWDKEVAMMKKKATQNGAKFIKLDPETAEWYTDIFYSAGWAYAEKNFPAEDVKRFKELLSK
jgi:TRAP-type C4-dicarboxylate transport system substrate-binding protein